MTYANLVLTTVAGVLTSITPMPTGVPPGVRKATGIPEIIPDAFFYTRELIPADDALEGQHDHLNYYIKLAIQYHKAFSITGKAVNSLEEFIEQSTTTSTPLGRLRLACHGKEDGVFLPIFKNGSWNDGLSIDLLNAFMVEKEADKGLRFLLTGSRLTGDKTKIVDLQSRIFNGLTTLQKSSLLSAFGITNPPGTDAHHTLFGIINDLFVIKYGTVLGTDGQLLDQPAMDLVTAILNRMADVIIARESITGNAFTNLKNEVLTNTDLPKLVFIKSSATKFVTADITAINTAAGTNNLQNIRSAFSANPTGSIFGLVNEVFTRAFTLLDKPVIKLGNTQILEDDEGNHANLSSIASSLDAFFDSCGDLFFINNAVITVNNNPINSSDKAVLINAVTVMTNLLLTEVNTQNPAVTKNSLQKLRTAIAGLSIRASAIKGFASFNKFTMNNLKSVLPALDGGFYNKLNTFRSLVQPGGKTFIDIRGCSIAAVPNFINTIATFLGNGANTPVVSAPEWWQSFSKGFTFVKPSGNDLKFIDDLVTAGVKRGTTTVIFPTDVTSSFDEWKLLVDFAPHFTFISSLFTASPTAFFDFATLKWRKWDTGSGGIPLLTMEAYRIDKITSLELSEIVMQFSRIFSLLPANVPGTKAIARLKQAGPSITEFAETRDKLAATPTPSAADRKVFFESLVRIATIINGLQGIPAPTGVLLPATDNLADIKTSVNNIQAQVDVLLNMDLSNFFLGVKGRLSENNADLRYYLNIGLPLLFQSGGKKIALAIIATEKDSTETKALRNAALQSFMRIQWDGTPAQRTEMNKVINRVNAANETALDNANFMNLVSKDDFEDNPGTDTEICPKPGFHAHIKP